MSSKGKATSTTRTTKTKNQPSKKYEKTNTTPQKTKGSDIQLCSASDSSASHQQHHSAPPSQNQQSKAGLQSINENVEYSSTNGTAEQQQQQNIISSHFPRSNTVPYPAYATFRRGVGNTFPAHYYYTDYPTVFHGTISSAQANAYFNNRQPLSSINTNFQPISPHRPQYVCRPVDILKPTFLIVPKEAEQQLTAQITSSNSFTKATNSTKQTSFKPMTKNSDTKTQETTTTGNEQSSPTVRSVEVQTNNHSPTRPTSAGESIMDNTNQHVDITVTPNPSPYVHFVNVSFPTQSAQFLQEGPPENSIMNDEFIQFNDYYQPSASIRSMPNIALAQVSPHHFYGSPTSQQNPHFQQMQNEQQHQAEQTQQEQHVDTQITSTESTVVRSATVPPMASTSETTHLKTGEVEKSSVPSLDIAHADLVDVPGSWKYRSLPDGRSVPITTAARRYRAPIPQCFLDSQPHPSDAEQVVRSSSFRYPPQQQSLGESRPFGSIPVMNGPFEPVYSQQSIQYIPSTRLNERDVLKVASFYKSIGTLVYVARSVATLYSSDFDAMANLKDWKKLYTGIPIWLFNTGMNPKRARSIRLVISELGSSFILWDTIVNGASDVRLPKPRHITLKSLETGTILALKFDDAEATDEFHQYFVKLSSNPRNADLFDVFNAKRHAPTFTIRKRKIKKSAISKPTDFSHITKVDENDREFLCTYSVLVSDGATVG